MNYRMLGYVLGRIFMVEAALLLPPSIVAVIYGEWSCLFAFVVTAVGLAVLDAIIKQTAFLESFSLSNFLWNLASGCILYAVLGGMGWLIGWLLHYAKESTHENKE